MEKSWMCYKERIMLCKDDKTTPDEFIDINTFEHLTGKKIDWSKREFKIVTSRRYKGHIRLYDHSFIPGEKYKNGKDVYLCQYLDNNGDAVLSKIGSIWLIVLDEPIKHNMEIA